MPKEEDDTDDTISHGELTLDPPKEGATFENPPDGGLRAWLIVLSCFLINVAMSIMLIMTRVSLLDSKMSRDTGIDSETLKEMDTQLVALTDLYAPTAALVMIFFGYKATVCIGSAVVMTTLFFISYLGDDDTEKFIKFLIFGPVAIGTSFIKLGALIPVLEYFTKKRMKALFLSKLGRYVGEIILLIIILASSDTKVVWRKFLRGSSGLCVVIGLLGLTLEELKLTMKDNRSVTFVQMTVELGSKDILKNLLFWFTCAVYFFYQWGIETPQGLFIDEDMTARIDMGANLAKILFYGLSQPIGQGLGMFVAWIVRKVLERNADRMSTGNFSLLALIFMALAATSFISAVGCFVAPEAVNFEYFFTFSLLFAFFFAFNEGMRDDIIPTEFGRDNIRIVEGLILMFAGLGGVITNEISAEIDNGDDNDWKNLFRYGGGMLLVSVAVTSIVLGLKQSKTIEEMQSKIHGNSVVPFRVDDSSQNINSIEQSAESSRNAVNNRQKNDRKVKTDLTTQSNNPPAVNSGFRPYNQSFVPTSSHNGGVQPYTQPTIGYINQNSAFIPQHQSLTLQYQTPRSGHFP